LCAVEGEGAVTWCCIPPEGGQEAKVWEAQVRGAPAYARAVWMGGAWLVACAHGRAIQLICLDEDTLTPRWQWDAPSRWLQGPIPAGSGALAAVDGDSVILLADVSDSMG
jgi:outer membrane protein assembly factor BamB